MNRRTIDAMREARLWTRDIIIPAGATLIMLMSYPTTRKTIVEAKDKTCNKVKSVFKKGE